MQAHCKTSRVHLHTFHFSCFPWAKQEKHDRRAGSYLQRKLRKSLFYSPLSPFLVFSQANKNHIDGAHMLNLGIRSWNHRLIKGISYSFFSPSCYAFKMGSQGWRGFSAVKRPCCTSRGPKFSSHQPSWHLIMFCYSRSRGPDKATGQSRGSNSLIVIPSSLGWCRIDRK